MRWSVPTALVAVLTLAGCSDAEPVEPAEQALPAPPADVSPEEVGALAAAQVYVDAIADLEVETADAMTNPDAFESLRSEEVDIRAILPQAQDPITDPWVAIASPGFQIDDEVAFLVSVSYHLQDQTGGEMITLRLEEGADPAQVESWIVDDPLLVTQSTMSRIPKATIGGVTLRYRDTFYRNVVGYPGGYLLQAPPGVEDVEPVWVPVGAQYARMDDDPSIYLGSE